MSKYSEKNFLKSFKYAIRGINLAIKSQRNIVRQIIVGFAAFFAGVFLHFSLTEFCILLIIISMVIISEMLNSAIEFTIDSVFKNKFSKLAGMAKDMAAGAVCIASFCALFVGSVLYLPKILQFVKGVL